MVFLIQSESILGPVFSLVNENSLNCMPGPVLLFWLFRLGINHLISIFLRYDLTNIWRLS